MNFYLTFFLFSLFTISWINSTPIIRETKGETKNQNETQTKVESEHNKNETTIKVETKHENKTTTQKSNKSPEVADRINLNFGTGESYAEGEEGEFSGSHSTSFGVSVGIKNNKTGEYTSLANGTGGGSTSYSFGPDSPQTWADTNSTAGETSATGNAKAGFSGGKGTSNADNYSNTEKIDMGDGSTMFANFRNATNATTTTTANPLQIKLVFH